MLLLKPYLSLQMRSYPYEDPLEHILYIGITIMVPDGFVLYLRHPNPKPNPANPNICSVKLELYRATGNRHSSPQDYLIGLDMEDWSMNTVVDVEVIYNEQPVPKILQDPRFEASKEASKCIGHSRMAVKNAGRLLAEEGFGDTISNDLIQDAFPIATLVDKIRSKVGKTVGPVEPPRKPNT